MQARPQRARDAAVTIEPLNALQKKIKHFVSGRQTQNPFTISLHIFQTKHIEIEPAAGNLHVDAAPSPPHMPLFEAGQLLAALQVLVNAGLYPVTTRNEIREG